MASSLPRRTFVASAGLAAFGAGARGAGVTAGEPEPVEAPRPYGPAIKGPGRFRQSVCRWCYSSMALDDLCRNAAALGAASVELLSENEWQVPAQFGLTCAVANGPTTIPRGLNRLELHDQIVREGERLLPLIKQAGIPNMIVFSGNRDGMPDDEGLRNSAKGLKRLTPLAESLGVTIVMELLNSKVDHRDYMCDRTPWGVALVHEVASDRFRLLYDIYHMQIMEGDVIRTIRDHAAEIGHYHTGGVPGRREIDHTQELYYPAICAAIADTGYTGFLGQEFIPSRDAMASLKQAIDLCRT
ncbi:MAG: TIM barrel protein [Phycisphaerales bacterium]|nr:TIM barrel protein [Phycisphaerales bacterium]